MAHFTQLGLSGEPERKPQNMGVRKPTEPPRPGPGGKKPKGTTAITICSVIAMSLLGASLLETGGCSKASKQASQISAPSASATSPMTPSSAMTPQPEPAVPPVEAKKQVAKKPRQHRLVASTYKNPTYGVTFRYFTHYQLKEGDKANEEWAGLQPVQMNFVQPGGTALSVVRVPERFYTGTDFAGAFFNLSVNTKLTAEECGQFVSPAASAGDKAAVQAGSGDAPETPQTVEPSKVKVGAAEFTEVENANGADAKQADTKYYHVFQNGTCYEFALGVETKGNGASDGVKSVNRDEVFRRLNWMLSTVKIQPAGVPAQATETASAPTTGVKD